MEDKGIKFSIEGHDFYVGLENLAPDILAELDYIEGEDDIVLDDEDDEMLLYEHGKKFYQDGLLTKIKKEIGKQGSLFGDSDDDNDDSTGGLVWTGKDSYYSCHKGTPHVFDLLYDGGERKVKVTAGGSNRTGSWEDMDVPPDVVLGPSDQVRPIVWPSGWGITTRMPIFIPLPWPDFSTPKLTDHTFWGKLLKDIGDHPEIENIHVMCAGGHGRTGTALSILYGLCNHELKTTDELVATIRKMYCSHVVESEAQMKYIATITGLPYQGKEKPYKSAYSTTTSSKGRPLLPQKEYNQMKQLAATLGFKIVTETDGSITLEKSAHNAKTFYSEALAFKYMEAILAKMEEQEGESSTTQN